MWGGRFCSRTTAVGEFFSFLVISIQDRAGFEKKGGWEICVSVGL